jgi:hypothetical protein
MTPIFVIKNFCHPSFFVAIENHRGIMSSLLPLSTPSALRYHICDIMLLYNIYRESLGSVEVHGTSGDPFCFYMLKGCEYVEQKMDIRIVINIWSRFDFGGFGGLVFPNESV